MLETHKENIVKSIPYDKPFTDINPKVWRLLVLTWGLFCAFMWLLFGRSAPTAFVLVVVVLFACVYFALPYLLISFSPETKTKNTDHVATFTGELSAKEAAIQILLIPVLLTLALASMAITALFIF